MGEREVQLKPWAKAVGGFVNQLTTIFPGWQARRAESGLKAAQANYMAFGYESASASIQRKQRASSILATSADGQLHGYDLYSIQEWSRLLWRNNPLYSSLFKRAADNIIGTGLVVNPKTDDKGTLNEELHAAFAEYTAKGGPWELTRRFSLAEAQRIAFFSVGRDGDFLGYRADEGWQFFEGGQIGTPRGYNTAGPRIIGGVQKDALDRPSYYWVSDYAWWGYIDYTTARGLRADLCKHVGRWDFFSQSRPLPVYQNALGMFEDFFRYLESHLLAAMQQACNTMEINSPHANVLAALGMDKANSADAVNRLKGVRMAPAQVVHTYTGEKLTMHNSTLPNNAFPEYVRQNLRMIGMPLGLPLEIALMDFSQTNFAGAKMAINQAQATFLGWRQMLVEQFLTPVYADWFDRVRSASTDIKIPKTLKYPQRFEIIEPQAGWIDAYKETLAINAQVEGGWETITHALKEHMGRELVDVVTESANELLTIKTVAKATGVEEDKLLQYTRGMLSGTSGGTGKPASEMQTFARQIAEHVVAQMT